MVEVCTLEAKEFGRYFYRAIIFGYYKNICLYLEVKYVDKE